MLLKFSASSTSTNLVAVNCVLLKVPVLFSMPLDWSLDCDGLNSVPKLMVDMRDDTRFRF